MRGGVRALTLARVLRHLAGELSAA